MDTVRWFKKRAKLIFKAIKNNDEDSIALYEKFWLDRNRPVTLMTVQHVVAKDAGFNNWSELVHADEEYRQAFIDSH